MNLNPLKASAPRTLVFIWLWLATGLGHSEGLAGNGFGWLDEFDDDAIDGELWSTYLPFPSSSVVESSGALTLQSRGMLLTTEEARGAYEVRGRFRMQNPVDHLRIVLRSDLTVLDPVYKDLNGVIVAIEAGGQVFIAEVGKGAMAVTNVSVGAGRWIDLRIVDRGGVISLYLDSDPSPLLQARSNHRPGRSIAFYNREFPGLALEIDFLAVHRPKRLAQVADDEGQIP